MSKQQKKHKTRGKNEPQQIGQIMKGLADNEEFILFNILKAMKA